MAGLSLKPQAMALASRHPAIPKTLTPSLNVTTRLWEKNGYLALPTTAELAGSLDLAEKSTISRPITKRRLPLVSLVKYAGILEAFGSNFRLPTDL